MSFGLYIISWNDSVSLHSYVKTDLDNCDLIRSSKPLWMKLSRTHFSASYGHITTDMEWGSTPCCHPRTAKRMVGSIWHQHSHGSSEPNKHSLASSLLRVVSSSGSLALKKFRYNLDAYISKYTNFYAFLWHIEQYRSIFTTESHVQRLDNLWITRMFRFCGIKRSQNKEKK